MVISKCRQLPMRLGIILALSPIFLLVAAPARAEAPWWTDWYPMGDGGYSDLQAQWIEDPDGVGHPWEEVGRLYWRADTKNGAADDLYLRSLRVYASCTSSTVHRAYPRSATVTNSNDDSPPGGYFYHHQDDSNPLVGTSPSIRWESYIQFFPGDPYFSTFRRIVVNDSDWDLC